MAPVMNMQALQRQRPSPCPHPTRPTGWTPHRRQQQLRQQTPPRLGQHGHLLAAMQITDPMRGMETAPMRMQPLHTLSTRISSSMQAPETGVIMVQQARPIRLLYSHSAVDIGHVQ
jgi:hypothetical protein